MIPTNTIDFFKSIKKQTYIVEKSELTKRIVGRLHLNLGTNKYFIALDEDAGCLEAEDLIEIGEFILKINKERKDPSWKAKKLRRLK